MVVTSRGARARRRLTAVLVGSLMLVVAACDATHQQTGAPSAAAVSFGPAATTPPGPPRPTPTPLPPMRLGIDWGKATDVARPGDDLAAPSPGSSVAFSLGSNRSGHPLHFAGQAMMADVIRLPSGRFVCVGYVYPGWHPQAWISDDAETWVAQDMGLTDFTFPVSMAVGADGTIVAVGRTGTSPLAWTSRDGTSWAAHPVPTIGTDGVAERMTTVVATPDGYLAGGSVGPELADRHARFWRSPDGVTWTPVPDDATAFADSEVRSITRLGDGYVAIGATGDVQDITGSVAWTSPDGVRWTRVDDPALAKGRAAAVVPAPFGGLVAVGSDLDEHEAFAWTTQDGRTWTLAPSETSRQYHGKVRFTDVTVVGDQLIGVGNYVGLQRGTATSWISTDGLHWEQARSAPVQEQGEFYAVVPGGPGIVAVGSFGAPDDYLPTVWLSPDR